MEAEENLALELTVPNAGENAPTRVYPQRRENSSSCGAAFVRLAQNPPLGWHAAGASAPTGLPRVMAPQQRLSPLSNERVGGFHAPSM
jgi:hypothetical protein